MNTPMWALLLMCAGDIVALWVIYCAARVSCAGCLAEGILPRNCPWILPRLATS